MGIVGIGALDPTSEASIRSSLFLVQVCGGEGWGWLEGGEVPRAGQEGMRGGERGREGGRGCASSDASTWDASEHGVGGWGSRPDPSSCRGVQGTSVNWAWLERGSRVCRTGCPHASTFTVPHLHRLKW